ncbi:hypothetical protein K469DRAFT_258523, partial [Zopfia rhizophila CBS 207.26]
AAYRYLPVRYFNIFSSCRRLDYPNSLKVQCIKEVTDRILIWLSYCWARYGSRIFLFIFFILDISTTLSSLNHRLPHRAFQAKNRQSGRFCKSDASSGLECLVLHSPFG